jgi:uncharacterized protein YdiU (UPF0061 family)
MRECLQMLSSLNIDYTLFLRELSHFKTEDTESFKGIWDYYGKRIELNGWLDKYSERLRREDEDVQKGSREKLEKWLEVFYHPFDEHPEFHAY